MGETIPELVLHDFPAVTGHDGWASFSPFVLLVDRALKLAKLPFRISIVNMMKLKELNPTGQLPVLTIGTENVADSTRILHRIEALAPGSMTGGLDARGVGEMWLWEEFADVALYPYVLTTRWADDKGWPVPKKEFFGGLPPVVRDFVANMVRKKTMAALRGRDFTRSGVEACYERMKGVLDSLEARAPEEGFWLGTKPTAADVGIFAQLHSLRIPHTPWRGEDIARRTKLTAWLDRVDAATSSS
jgi:glutathione S-transferase